MTDISKSDFSRLLIDQNEAIAESIAMIVAAIAKHIADPNALFDDLRDISAPNVEHNVPMSLFMRRFKQGIDFGEDELH